MYNYNSDAYDLRLFVSVAIFAKLVLKSGFHSTPSSQRNLFKMLGPVVLNEPVITNPNKSAPMDPRYPNQNQAKNCWQNYVDYYRCINKRGEEYEPCQYFFKNYNTLCPMAWVERWNDQREGGSFPAKL